MLLVLCCLGCFCMADSMRGSSQWETSLQSNAVSHSLTGRKPRMQGFSCKVFDQLAVCWGHFYKQGIIGVTTWISTQIHVLMWKVITYTWLMHYSYIYQTVLKLAQGCVNASHCFIRIKLLFHAITLMLSSPLFMGKEGRSSFGKFEIQLNEIIVSQRTCWAINPPNVIHNT